MKSSFRERGVMLDHVRRGSVHKRNIPCLSLAVLCLFAAAFPSRALAQDADVAKPQENLQNQDHSGNKEIEQIDLTDLKRHCATLAADAFEGREAGTNGGKAAAAYIQTELKKFKGIQPAGTTGWLQEFGKDYSNILVVLPGSDPQLADEFILIGAHYDHVGRGNSSNSQGPIGQIHNGADDNASGVSALLELIQAFSSEPTSPRRTLLFAFWDAEEVGLLGSRHWVKNPTRPKANLKFVMNIDMLGRLRDGKLRVAGWRSAAGLRHRLVKFNRETNFSCHFEREVIGDSDHFPFHAASIPVLHIDTDKHNDYHRPTDDADKLNYAGLKQIAEFVHRWVHGLANEPTLPRFRREALSEQPPRWLTTRRRSPPRVRLGVTFDNDQIPQNKAIIASVTAGSPAEQAGIRVGDEIIRAGAWTGGDIPSLRSTIQLSPEEFPVTIRRTSENEPLERTVKLAGSPVRVGLSWVVDAAVPGSVGIADVVPDTPADQAGLKGGDLIIEFDGKPIDSDAEFGQRLKTEPGPFRLRIDRNGRISEHTVVVPKPIPAAKTDQPKN